MLLLWRDVSLYDPVAQQPESVAPTKVTLRLAGAQRTWRSTGRREHGTGGPGPRTSLPLKLDGHVTAVLIAPRDATVPGKPVVRSRDPRGTPGHGAVETPADDGGLAVTRYRLTSGDRTLTVGPDKRRATLKRLPEGRRLRVGVRARNALGWGKIAWSDYVRTHRPPVT